MVKLQLGQDEVAPRARFLEISRSPGPRKIEENSLSDIRYKLSPIDREREHFIARTLGVYIFFRHSSRGDLTISKILLVLIFNSHILKKKKIFLNISKNKKNCLVIFKLM